MTASTLPAYERGAIIAFGQFEPRIGIVIGAFNHPTLGEAMCVYTPVNAIKGQAYDLVALELSTIRPATPAELREYAEVAVSEMRERLAAYLDRISDAKRDGQEDTQP